MHFEQWFVERQTERSNIWLKRKKQNYARVKSFDSLGGIRLA